jgi:hypothetical protein
MTAVIGLLIGFILILAVVFWMIYNMGVKKTRLDEELGALKHLSKIRSKARKKHAEIDKNVLL